MQRSDFWLQDSLFSCATHFFPRGFIYFFAWRLSSWSLLMPGSPGFQDYSAGQSGCRVSHSDSPPKRAWMEVQKQWGDGFSLIILAILGVHLLQESDSFQPVVCVTISDPQCVRLLLSRACCSGFQCFIFAFLFQHVLCLRFFPCLPIWVSSL